VCACHRRRSDRVDPHRPGCDGIWREDRLLRRKRLQLPHACRVLYGSRLSRYQSLAAPLGAGAIRQRPRHRMTICMSFCDQLRKKAQPIWDAQLRHPFVVALGNGTLPERKFKYYILQDARFLGDLARVFSAGALRAPDSESALRLTKLVEETIVVERSLHEGYGSRWRMSAEQMSSVAMAPTNY